LKWCCVGVEIDEPLPLSVEASWTEQITATVKASQMLSLGQLYSESVDIDSTLCEKVSKLLWEYVVTMGPHVREQRSRH
jgi:hydroxylamine reductase (hybrid-cluster protein)